MGLRRRWVTWLGVCAGCLLPVIGIAAPPDNPWARQTEPAKGPAAAIGGYSAGCIQGATGLPLDGPGYQVMRPGRRRYFGHPELVDYVRDLGSTMQTRKLGVLLVGDLGQVRGGPAPSGHSSHQSGLDVDLWYWHPRRALKGPLPEADREKLEARNVVNWKAREFTSHWSDRVAGMLEHAASDQRVARIFVNPLIKKRLCEQSPEPRAWLGKLRPWWGHADHFHVRLQCPSGSPDCKNQARVKPGDGCAEVDWWLRPETERDRKKGQKRYQSTVGAMPELPAACQPLIESSP